MVEEVISASASAAPQAAGTRRGLGGESHPRRLDEIEGDAEERMELSMGEFARVLGGGVVPGSIVLVGGDPGIGKSTLMLQVAIEMAARLRVLYVSGEESERQIKMRALRLLQPQRRPAYGAKTKFPKNLFLVTETNLDIILEHITTVKPDLLIVDSIQTVYMPELNSTPGSVTQVRESAARPARAGQILRHGSLPDRARDQRRAPSPGRACWSTSWIRCSTWKATVSRSFRLLRSVKNRFGATSEVGVFEMRGAGMLEVRNPSEAFLAERMVNTPGSAIAVTMEGTRPILVEIQGLTSATTFGNPRRTPNGVDFNRLLLITAVLTRRLGFHLFEAGHFRQRGGRNAHQRAGRRPGRGSRHCIFRARPSGQGRHRPDGRNRVVRRTAHARADAGAPA